MLWQSPGSWEDKPAGRAATARANGMRIFE
jgi:hypothetical protein